MGLYQSVDFMACNGLLDGFSKSDQEILAMPMIKYIYKFTCIPTGQFYIGQTNCLKDRFYQHILGISQFDSGKISVQPFHILLGPSLLHYYEVLDSGRKKKPSFEIFVRKSCKGYVYAIAGDQETADLLEVYYINKFRNDNLCLNIK